MYKEIKMRMADGNSRNIPLLANGATALRFRMTFGRELLDSISNIAEIIGVENIQTMMKSETAGGDEQGIQDAIESGSIDPQRLRMMIKIAGSSEMDTISQLAYIMNRDAEKADMRKLCFEDYVDWLETFESMELLSHSGEIFGLYMSNRAKSSTAKKKQGRPTGK